MCKSENWDGPYPRYTQTNPNGPGRGDERPIRGGNWPDGNEYGFLWPDNRPPFAPRADNYIIGFRCVVLARE
jgi:formylglycine-generating enzyme required for sulfatase activity